jgi:hypothetical protein
MAGVRPAGAVTRGVGLGQTKYQTKYLKAGRREPTLAAMRRLIFGHGYFW